MGGTVMAILSVLAERSRTFIVILRFPKWTSLTLASSLPSEREEAGREARGASVQPLKKRS
jgi:hypothetical protein